jgi:hypothetical protein
MQVTCSRDLVVQQLKDTLRQAVELADGYQCYVRWGAPDERVEAAEGLLQVERIARDTAAALDRISR